MGSLANVIMISIGPVICLGFLGMHIVQILTFAPDPPILEDTWWGKEKPTGNQSTLIKSFKVNVDSEVLRDLKKRLEGARPFIPPIENAAQNYGMNSHLLGRVVDFWLMDYNWTQRQAYLNKYPQYKTNIQGLDIHFYWIKPKNPQVTRKGFKPLPLLLLHGWGSSVREYLEVVPLITANHQRRHFYFLIVIPSLPGFGFSDATQKAGLGAAEMGLIFKNLMSRLGYKQFYVHGSDWGGTIASHLATLYPDTVKGIHSTSCSVSTPMAFIKYMIGTLYPGFIEPTFMKDKIYPLMDFINRLWLDFGFLHMHATKPDTLGIALHDSPVGLAAYLLEKFTLWTNPEYMNRDDGGLDRRYSYNDLIDTVMIYWISNSVTSSLRLTAESLKEEQLNLNLNRIPIEVPSVCLAFTNDNLYYPRSLLEEKYKHLMYYTIQPGGHFVGFEHPDVLASDLYSAAEAFEEFYLRLSKLYNL